MRRAAGLTGGLAFAICFTILFPGSHSIAAESGDAAIAAHIRQIEDHILPAVLIAGRPLPDRTLKDRMAALNVLGISIAVIHNGRIEWARGFGTVAKDGAPVTADTLFQAASISKPVTAFAVMRLVQAGKLDLDADVNRYLRSWKIPPSRFAGSEAINLRELLSHTAGMSVSGFTGYRAGSPLPTLQQILDGEAPANNSPIRVVIAPNTEWRYSGGGYVVIQQMIDDMTGKTFPAFMQDEVLKPTGMTLSTYEQPLPLNRMRDIAMPYRADGTPVPGGPHVYPEMAPAGLWTTPSDLARFAIAMQKSLSGAKGALLSRYTAEEMVKPRLQHWGLGFTTGRSSGRPYFGHTGANEGFQCDLIAYAGSDGAVVMTNSDNGYTLAHEIVRSIAHEYGWPDLSPKTRSAAPVDPGLFDDVAGNYEVSPESIITVTRDGDHLSLKETRHPALELFPGGGRVFFTTDVEGEASFANSVDGHAAALTANIDGNSAHAIRVSDGDPAVRWNDALQKRIAADAQGAGTEQALLDLFKEWGDGNPAYEKMSPGLAGLLEKNSVGPKLKLLMDNLGPPQTLRFENVSENGEDVFTATYAKSSMTWKILLGPDGKVLDIDYEEN